MYLMIWIAVLIIVYVSTFKDDFKKEHIEKAGVFIFITCGIFIVLGLLLSIVGS